MPACRDCRFFKVDDSTCHRYPPQQVMIRVAAVYPEINGGDTACGEYKSMMAETKITERKVKK